MISAQHHEWFGVAPYSTVRRRLQFTRCHTSSTFRLLASDREKKETRRPKYAGQRRHSISSERIEFAGEPRYNRLGRIFRIDGDSGMPTIEVNAPLGGLLKAVEQLDSREFEQFFGSVLALRAKRTVNLLSAEETDLLLRINQGLPEELLERYRPLSVKRDERTLTSEEHLELLRLSEEIERREAERVSALANLAAHRKTTLGAVMANLGLRGPSNGV
jgi:hypothetical protein